MRVWIGVGLLCISFAVASQGQSPPHSQGSQQQPAQSEQRDEGAEPDQPAPSANATVDAPLPNDANSMPSKESGYEHQQGEEKSSAELWIAVATVALAFITGALAWYTSLLWGATKRIAEETTKSSERQLRAYVGPISHHVRGVGSVAPLRACIVIKNTGQTPAHNVRCLTWIYAKPFDKTPFNIAPTKSEVDSASLTVIFPGGELTIDQLRSQDDLPAGLADQERYAFFSGDLGFLVCGKIIFSDVLGHVRETTFHYKLGGNAMPHGDEPPEGYAMAAQSNGNTAT